MSVSSTVSTAELVPIGEAARRAGVAPSALRYYEERGILAPATRISGRRWYGRDELRKLAFIQMAQRLGFSLDAVAAVFDESGPPWHAVLDAHIGELEGAIRRSTAARRILLHGRDCPHESPWRECPYLLGALDAWLESGGRDAAFEAYADTIEPGALGSASVSRQSHVIAPVRPASGTPTEPELAGLRKSYERGALVEEWVASDPLEQFRRWLHDALVADIPEPNAMVLATATADGVPSARTVLLKGLDGRGFAFYTNHDSDKGRELDTNPRASLVFPWHAMERQVRVSGSVSRLDRAESAAYFATRPRESRLGAWASRQSEVVEGRSELDQAYAEMEERWPGDSEIPLPDFWGGYRVRAEMLEFWQGRHGRLHDRLRYRRGADGWVLERLAP